MTAAGPGLTEVIESLERAIHRRIDTMDSPAYVRGHFRYRAETSRVMQVLKAVRVVSGLRAAVHLATVAHLQEGAVVLRAVYDALQDIEVLDEAHFSKDGAKEYQKRLVDEFFQDDVLRLQATLGGEGEGVGRIPRRKKVAAIERRLAPASDGSPLRPALNGINLLLDGYTHSGYAQIMEMYSVSASGGRFNMAGIHSAKRLREFLWWTAQFAHPALNVVSQLLRDVQLDDEAEQLISLRKTFEESDEYPRRGREEGVV